jgi:hypothetical protein
MQRPRIITRSVSANDDAYGGERIERDRLVELLVANGYQRPTRSMMPVNSPYEARSSTCFLLE